MHWHIVDSQSFPFESTTYPLLAQKGAWVYPSHTYSPAQVQVRIKCCCKFYYCHYLIVVYDVSKGIDSIRLRERCSSCSRV
jgi:N-acetyl-beta-hexosaminidase